MIDIISNWQTIVSIGALLITVGGLIFMNRDYSKRILKIEEWKERIVDGKLSDIEKKIDIIIVYLILVFILVYFYVAKI